MTAHLKIHSTTYYFLLNRDFMLLLACFYQGSPSIILKFITFLNTQSDKDSIPLCSVVPTMIIHNNLSKETQWLFKI